MKISEPKTEAFLLSSFFLGY